MVFARQFSLTPKYSEEKLELPIFREFFFSPIHVRKRLFNRQNQRLLLHFTNLTIFNFAEICAMTFTWHWSARLGSRVSKIYVVYRCARIKIYGRTSARAVHKFRDGFYGPTTFSAKGRTSSNFFYCHLTSALRDSLARSKLNMSRDYCAPPWPVFSRYPWCHCFILTSRRSFEGDTFEMRSRDAVSRSLSYYAWEIYVSTSHSIIRVIERVPSSRHFYATQ